MIFILDASTLINLANGGILNIILELPDTLFYVSRLVREESKTIAAAVDQAVESGKLALVDDAAISIEEFAQAKTLMRLGDGETECILAARAMRCGVGCDDATARAQARRQLGAARLKGSIGFLRMAVDSGLLTQNAAAEAYQLMLDCGGYLPSPETAGFSALPA